MKTNWHLERQAPAHTYTADTRILGVPGGSLPVFRNLSTSTLNRGLECYAWEVTCYAWEVQQTLDSIDLLRR